MKKLLLISAFVLISCSPVEEDTRLICDCSDTSYEMDYSLYDRQNAAMYEGYISMFEKIPAMTVAAEQEFLAYKKKLQELKKYAFNRPQGIPSKNACGQAPASDNNVLVFNRSKNKFIWNGKDISLFPLIIGNKEYGANIWKQDYIDVYYRSEITGFDASLLLGTKGMGAVNRLNLDRVNLQLVTTKMSLLTSLEALENTGIFSDQKALAKRKEDVIAKTMAVVYQCRVVQGI